jgi:hypothetical protein
MSEFSARQKFIYPIPAVAGFAKKNIAMYIIIRITFLY